MKKYRGIFWRVISLERYNLSCACGMQQYDLDLNSLVLMKIQAYGPKSMAENK
jgi:hypothetical protein